MKKIILLLGCIVLVVSLSIVACSCVTYDAKPGKMEALIGTYKLTTYDVTPDAVEGDESSFEQRTQNYMTLKGTEAYLVITGGDIGYYFYKDSETAWWCETIRLEYEYSENNNGEKTNLVEKVSFTNSVTSGSTYPGAGSEKVGFNVKKKTLHYKEHSYHGKYININNTTSVTYTKVSDDTTMAYATNAIGKTFTIPRYELKKFTGVLLYELSLMSGYGDVSEYNPFIYCVVEFDNITLDATVHYALKSDYNDGKRDAELKKSATYKVEVSENDTSIVLNFKFADADDNAIYTIDKANATLMATGTTFDVAEGITAREYLGVFSGSIEDIDFDGRITGYGNSVQQQVEE